LHTFAVYPTRLEHPIMEGIEAFCVRDELYMQAYNKDVVVLMVAVDRGVAYPMVWTRDEGQGRVAHIALGHTSEVWESAHFQCDDRQAVPANDSLANSERRRIPHVACDAVAWRRRHLPVASGGTMGRVDIRKPAPDFCLEDAQGREVCLADYRGQKHVLLVFNRGFA
jgi:hypothetical protein